MSNFYIVKCGGKISKSGNHLVFTDYDGNAFRILLTKINKIIAYHTLSVTAEAFYLLSKSKVKLLFKNCAGVDNISVSYGECKNVFIRHAQYKISADEKLSSKTAKMIVRGKLKNQIAFMQRMKRTDSYCKETIEDIFALKLILKDIDNCSSLAALRGLEGIASKHYFAMLSRHIKPEWAVFEKRSKNPPLTNVNAVLSFLYTMLAQEVLFAVQANGLDSMTGTLHELFYGRNSLVCDLMEEYRAPFADTVCAMLFNEGVLFSSDFKQKGEAVYLSREGIKKVVYQFEKKMESCLKYDSSEKTIREIIIAQVELYKKYVMGEVSEYIAYVYK